MARIEPSATIREGVELPMDEYFEIELREVPEVGLGLKDEPRVKWSWVEPLSGEWINEWCSIKFGTIKATGRKAKLVEICAALAGKDPKEIEFAWFDDETCEFAFTDGTLIQPQVGMKVMVRGEYSAPKLDSDGNERRYFNIDRHKPAGAASRKPKNRPSDTPGLRSEEEFKAAIEPVHNTVPATEQAVVFED